MFPLRIHVRTSILIMLVEAKFLNHKGRRRKRRRNACSLASPRINKLFHWGVGGDPTTTGANLVVVYFSQKTAASSPTPGNSEKKPPVGTNRLQCFFPSFPYALPTSASFPLFLSSVIQENNSILYTDRLRRQFERGNDKLQASKQAEQAHSLLGPGFTFPLDGRVAFLILLYYILHH